jgi:UTP--glucose-1-phosphate uridylyltransferase
MSASRTLSKCLFPVAGYGTRFLPATKSVPKEMLPIVAKPLLEYCVEECMRAGLYEMCFVTGRGKRAIADYFDVNYELEMELKGTPKAERLRSINEIMDATSFSFTRQVRIQGLGHAVNTGRMLVGDNVFGLVLSDNLCFTKDGSPNVMQILKEQYERHGLSVMAVAEVPSSQRSLYGIVEGKQLSDGSLRVRKMVEKPTDEKQVKGNLAIIGRYILTPEIFAYLDKTKPGKNNEIQLTDALCAMMDTTGLLAVPVQIDHFDCGNVHGFVEATNYCYKRFYRE